MRVKICFAVFGEEADRRVFEAIHEVRELFNKYLNIEWKEEVVRSDLEPSYWDGLGCYFAHAGDVRRFAFTIPCGYDVYVVLWRAKGKKVCWAGGTWNRDFGIMGGCLCSIPYDLWDCFLPVGRQWKYRLSQRISHELLNALHALGVVKYSPEKCHEYGFRDPVNGWRECHEWILSGGKRRKTYSWWQRILMWLSAIFRWWR